MKGIVVGLGKYSSTEGTEYFTGEECVAELLEPLNPHELTSAEVDPHNEGWRLLLVPGERLFPPLDTQCYINTGHYSKQVRTVRTSENVGLPLDYESSYRTRSPLPGAYQSVPPSRPHHNTDQQPMKKLIARILATLFPRANHKRNSSTPYLASYLEHYQGVKSGRV